MYDRDVTFVRVYIQECDRGRKKSLMDEILDILHDQHGMRGGVVFRGIAGFDNEGKMHCADVLRLMVDLPLVVEFFDKPAVVEAAIRGLSGLVTADHTVQWQARR